MLRIFLGLCLLLTLTSVAIAEAESITEFQSDIDVQSDGSLSVTETIRYDFGTNNRHGIFRTLPLEHPQTSGTWYTDRVLDVTILEVLRGSSSALYTATESRGELEIKIGDPDRTITGAHTYTIKYEVAGALTYYGDGSVDLYWNVTGDEWTVPIEHVRTTISGAAVATDTIGSCYVGQTGSGASCTDTRATDAGVVFTADRLKFGSGLTVAQALDPSAVAIQTRESWNLWWLWLTVAGLWLVSSGIYSYRYYHRHNPRHSIVTQFEPYADFRPMFTGVLFDGTLHSRDITAGILYLAEQGFLRIRKLDQTVLWVFKRDDYEVALLRDPEEVETTFQRELLWLLFADSAAVGTTVTLSTLKKSTARQKKNRIIINKLKKGIEQDLVTRGFYEKSCPPVLRHGWIAVIGLVVTAVTVVALGLESVELVLGAVVLCVATAALLTIVSHRRTRIGYAARNHLQGFKRFLAMTDTERFAFHDAPSKSPEQFTEYLPYAVAFAVEKEWAEVFADITIPQPSWYTDGSGTNQFLAANLVSDLDTFSQSFSQSSGSAASSGGGSAGGGAGGGGGGSW